MELARFAVGDLHAGVIEHVQDHPRYGATDGHRSRSIEALERSPHSRLGGAVLVDEFNTSAMRCEVRIDELVG